jgi:uncharacterized membrane protein YkvA (DUF1232 family)
MSTTRPSVFSFFARGAWSRLFRFRQEAVLLWRAFFHPETPLYLKAATVFAAAYLISPIDLIPDFIPLAGWADDIVLVPLLVSWIVGRLPPHVTATPVDVRRV